MIRLVCALLGSAVPAVIGIAGISGQKAVPPEKDLAVVVKTVRKGIKALGLQEKDLRPDHDFLAADAFRLGRIDAWLDRPLSVVEDSYRTFGAWLRKERSLTGDLVRAFADLDDSRMKSPVPTSPEGNLEDAILAFRPTRAGDLKAVPTNARPYLARLLRAVHKAVELREHAFRALEETQWVQLRKFGSQFNTGMPPNLQVQYLKNYHSRIDVRKVFQAALQVAVVLDGLPDFLKVVGKVKDRPSFHLVWETPAGRIEFGGWGRNTYKKDALLTVDFGGDDVYENSAGGTLYTPRKTSICIDLAGDDTYETTVGLAQGSGMYGVGMLVDCRGDDSYQSKNVSQGAGHVGVGVLWDWDGKDRYDARSVSQGAGFQGIGLLRDDNGKDRYRVGIKGQGFGTTLGLGILLDRKGNDTYSAGGLVEDAGRNPGHYLSLAQGYGQGNRSGNLAHASSGGIGVLADIEGADTYVSDVFGQGCAYYYAVGILLDGSGDDTYEVHDYGQGAGFHMAVGVHMDLAGDDRYAGKGHALGHALDRSVGCFIEFSGNDTYESGESESQGAAVKPKAVAFFADLRGRDTYKNGTPGYVRIPDESYAGQWPRAFFMDLAGKDRYAPYKGTFIRQSGYHGKAGNNRTWKTNTYGWGTDR